MSLRKKWTNLSELIGVPTMCTSVTIVPRLSPRVAARVAEASLQRSAKLFVDNVRGAVGRVAVTKMNDAIRQYLSGSRCPARFQFMARTVTKRILFGHPLLIEQFSRFIRLCSVWYLVFHLSTIVLRRTLISYTVFRIFVFSHIILHGLFIMIQINTFVFKSI